MESNSWTLKVEFQGERRRLKDWVPEGAEPTVALVRSGAATLFEISSQEVTQVLKLQYKDNEGEVCTLTDMTLPDALCLSVESRTLRVMVCEPEVPQIAANVSNPTIDSFRAHFQDGGARLRTGLEQFGTHVSNGFQHGRINAQTQAQHLSASASSGIQAGSEHLHHFGANVQESTSNLRASADHFVEDLGSNVQTKSASLRATIGQISSEIQTNLQEGREGFRLRSEQLSGDLRESTLQLRQSITKSVDVLTASDGAPEGSKIRMASAVVAGGATLAVTRSFPLAVTLGALAASAAGGRPVQESAGSEETIPEVVRPTSEHSDSDAEELVDSDVISLASNGVEEYDGQAAQPAVVEPSHTEDDDVDDVVLVDPDSGSTDGHNSEASIE